MQRIDWWLPERNWELGKMGKWGQDYKLLVKR